MGSTMSSFYLSPVINATERMHVESLDSEQKTKLSPVRVTFKWQIEQVGSVHRPDGCELTEEDLVQAMHGAIRAWK